MTDQNERIEIIRDAARTAYENIDKCGYAITSFEPGDGTRYVVIIGVDPDGYDWWVSLGGYGGRTYRWHPDNSTFTDKEYCGHWTSNQRHVAFCPRSSTPSVTHTTMRPPTTQTQTQTPHLPTTTGSHPEP